VAARAAAGGPVPLSRRTRPFSMARPARFSHDDLLDAAARVADSRGPAGASIQAIAREAGAPTGSLYHRFASRDVLLGALWIRTAERFHAGWLEELDPDPTAAAAFVAAFGRERPVEARLLLGYRPDDFAAEAWPPAAATRAEAIEHEQQAALHRAAYDRLGAATDPAIERMTVAVVDLPQAAVRRHLLAGRTPDAALARLLRDAAAAVLRA
jgi:AcrR family transcriptional regulator